MTTPTAQFSDETSPDGRFDRQASRFTDRITADGSGGFPAVAGRYHLYVSLACPWAHRQIIVRSLMGLEDVITMSVVNPIRDERGWNFEDGFDDPVNGFDLLAEAYHARDPDYAGRVTVPCIWDRERGTLVTNAFRVIDEQLATAFRDLADDPGVDLYPEHLREDIDALDAVLYDDVNNGVYKAGFATSQEAYENAYDALFARLDDLDARLADSRYLVGGRLTLADIRLFTTLVRFDAVYHDHFRCNRDKLAELGALWDYARDLYQTPGFGDTTDFGHIKAHYYRTHDRLNPTRIVPKGPATDWHAPHGRDTRRRRV